MTDALISLNDINKSFGQRHVLQDVSFDLNRNEITTLVGPNGAGKSTLVRIILGLLKADSGQVTPNEPLRIGYMPQQLSIDPTLPLTVRRFLQLADSSQHDCLAALDRVAINHLSTAPIQSLSGGELQRVLLARAILRKPNFLVLDEPVQGVDVTGQNALYQMIKELNNELDCAILMVSHDLHIVMSSTDRVICLNHHICCQGHPEQVRVDPSYIDIFGHSTAVYTHHHDHQHDLHGEVLNDKPRREDKNGEGSSHHD